jgi:hypothetical protein
LKAIERFTKSGSEEMEKECWNQFGKEKSGDHYATGDWDVMAGRRRGVSVGGKEGERLR